MLDVLHNSLRETATDDKFTQRAHLNVGGIARSFRGLSVESQVGQLASSAGSKLLIETHAAP